MKWETPQAIDTRFGFEITMYISTRWTQRSRRAVRRASASCGAPIFCWRPPS